jgi:hypothetical protein
MQRFARQFAMFAGPCGGLSGEVGIGSCEMTDANELKARDPALIGGLGELALRSVSVGEQLFADVFGAVCAQGFEVG